MERMNEISGLMKDSIGKYMAFSKIMQDTAKSAFEFQVQSTKEYMDWTMKTNSQLMKDMLTHSSEARKVMTENLQTFSEAAKKAVPTK